MLRQLEALARRQPMLLIFEDLHWIDPSSRELLDRTIERAANLPVFIVATHRTEFTPPWNGFPHVTTITLNRFDRRVGAALVGGVPAALRSRQTWRQRSSSAPTACRCLSRS